MKAHIALGIALSLTGATWSRAEAAPLCMTVDEFNAYFAGSQEAASTLTLQFTVTGVRPADFDGSKGCLAELDDDRCAVGSGFAAASLKVYGTATPPNTSHPPGTLKFEYGNECCAAPPCTEHWAAPNPSASVFADGTEECRVRIWLDPGEYGYYLECGSASFEATGDNVDGLEARRVSLLARTDGGWAMPNATSSFNEICFEPPVPDPGQTTASVPAREDVTASVGSPNAVYALIDDLSVEAGDSEIFLKFDLSSVAGQIDQAEIRLHLSDGASAAGSGGDACAVADDSWSEQSLTWNTRPACSGPVLARVAPADGYQWFAWDVSAAVSAPDVYSFAIVPEATDTNGSHFFSKEGSVSLAPELWVVYDATAAGGSGGAGGFEPDSHAAGGEAGAEPRPEDEPGAGSTEEASDQRWLHGCACRMPRARAVRSQTARPLAATALALLTVRARTRRRRPRGVGPATVGRARAG